MTNIFQDIAFDKYVRVYGSKLIQLYVYLCLLFLYLFKVQSRTQLWFHCKKNVCIYNLAIIVIKIKKSSRTTL